ncbi:hypothetical protein F0562_015353 [Nyssa sinensis]|uniref:Protein kinase domain-containing protein n=1 Tax=Nyssa sinensis TaxID=561372 RepID=A0A5J4ZK02_9ASTE|nr:hypothetical protein F0562_015353 [Nyssa sinensis]
MEGTSPDRESVGSGTKKSSVSSGEKSAHKTPNFDVPFELIDLQKFDYALEGVSFQQLIRMPSAVYASTSGAVEATAYLAIEDFLHASVKGLWEEFWSHDGPMPFNVACLYDANLKFYQGEKAIANGKLGGLCATAGESDQKPSLSIMGEALFFAIRILLSRNLSRSNISSLNSVFVLLVDSQYGGVVKVEGDVNNMEFDVNNVYGCAAEWIKNYSRIAVSPVDRIWNKLGNANWGDIGALQVLFATFHCITQYAGMPKHSVEDLAADHSSRLQTRRIERQLGDTRVNGNGLFRFQQRSASPEIVEVQEESIKMESEKSMKLEVGSVLWLEDSNWQKGFQINEVLNDGEIPYYIASSMEDLGRALFLYVGSHPSQLEPAWEDMKLWYQVQRQTKILTVMKQKGLSSKYLPHLSSSGRIIHPAIRCCHDCLSALSTAAAAGIRHGDIRPENVICVKSGVRQPYFVLVGWGHAILEERDRPAMNLHFSSTYALQEGKLCSASDAESLVYLLYFSSGGDLPDLDSVEGALQWRETSWSKRLIQQKLGDISAVLKAFADYVDSLCGTPYPMDYGIWLRRLRRHIQEEDHGKEVDSSS